MIKKDLKHCKISITRKEFMKIEDLLDIINKDNTYVNVRKINK